jgi:hypothetical protein
VLLTQLLIEYLVYQFHLEDIVDPCSYCFVLVAVTFVDSGDKALEYLGLLDSIDNVNATSSSSSSQSPQQEVRLS